MSTRKAQEYHVLSLNKFNEHCSVLGVKELSCYDPDKKAIERAFRKRALKTHPDKGGDPVEFKKINDAYNRLMGHIIKLEQQTEENELAESILIEVSKTSIPKWTEKLKRCYGYPKSSDCKCIIFEGPFKQFKGRSKNTGPITVVLYEDPQDKIPKIHVRSPKYMAWIAEQMLPVHMHVEKGRSIQFDQWRICHVAEFGIAAFKNPLPTPAPVRKEPKPKPEPKSKRKARDNSAPAAKARRDSEPTPESGTAPGGGTQEGAPDKENKVPNKETNKPDLSSSVFKEADINPDEWEEVPEDSADPFPKLYNMADQSFIKNGKRYRRKVKETAPQQPKTAPREEKAFNCGHCGCGFDNIVEYSKHKKLCIPDEDFGLTPDIMESFVKQSSKLPQSTSTTGEQDKPDPAKDTKSEEVKSNNSETDKDRKISFDFLTSCAKVPSQKSADEPSYTCGLCKAGFELLKEYTKHKTVCITSNPTDPDKKTSENVSKKNVDANGSNEVQNDCNNQDKNVKQAQTHSTQTIDKEKNCQTSDRICEKESIPPNNPASVTAKEIPKKEDKEDNKKRENIPLTKPSKVTKASKPPKTPKLKATIEKDMKIDKPSKQTSAGESKNNIQMESLRENLPTASSKASDLETGGGDFQPKTGQKKRKIDTQANINHDKPSDKLESTEENAKTDKTPLLKSSIVQGSSSNNSSGQAIVVNCDQIKAFDEVKESKKKNQKLKNIQEDNKKETDNSNQKVDRVETKIDDTKNAKLSETSIEPQTNPSKKKKQEESKCECVSISDVVSSPVSHIEIKKSEITPEKSAVSQDNLPQVKQSSEVLNLDVEALRVSNDIFKLAPSESEVSELPQSPVKLPPPTKPEPVADTSRRPSVKPQPIHQGSLDREAIKICNSIFSDTTKMTQEQMNGNEECIKKKEAERKQKTDAEIPKVPKPAKKDDIDLSIKHAKQCIVINSPILDSPLSPTLNRKPVRNSPVEPRVCQVNIQERQINSAVKIGDNNADKDKKIHSQIIENEHVLSQEVKPNLSPQLKDRTIMERDRTNDIGSNSAQPEEVQKNIETLRFSPELEKNRNVKALSPNRTIQSRYEKPIENKLKEENELKDNKTAISSKTSPRVGRVKRFEGSPPSRNTASTEVGERTKTEGKHVLIKETKENHENVKNSPKAERSTRFQGTPPMRNATIADMSKMDKDSFHPLTQSSSFAFSNKSPMSPTLSRRNFDRNFNTSPAPFLGGKYSVHFSEPSQSKSSASRTSAASSGSNSRLHSLSSSPSKHSNTDYRAKSEGYAKTPEIGNTYSVSTSSVSADLFHRIQATKDQYMKSYNKAMNFEKTSKPVMIKEKLPRPGKEYSKYSSSLERAGRSQGRERTVIDKLLPDKSGRGISLDNKSFRY